MDEPRDGRTSAHDARPGRRRQTTARLSQIEHHRKEQVLTQHRPSHIDGHGGVVLKRGDLCLLCNEAGDVPSHSSHPLGLYLQDVRFLDQYELTVNGQRLTSLSSDYASGYRTSHYLTNPTLTGRNGETIERNSVQVVRERLISRDVIVELIRLRNFASTTVELVAHLAFSSRFEDLFVLKGFVDEPRAEPSPVQVQRPDMAHLRSRGIDGKVRATYFGFDPAPDKIALHAAEFHIDLAARQEQRIAITIEACIGERPLRFTPQPVDAVVHSLTRRRRTWPGKRTGVNTSHETLNRVLDQAFSDLGLLRSRMDGLTYFAAGIPWFATLFGRDSALVAMQVLPFAPRVARDTARLLARFQARGHDDYRDAEPGKILHELRRGELANAACIPQSPAYYGSVDATLLFLMLIAAYVDWTGDVALVAELRSHIDLALDWIDEYGDHDGDGYLDYVGAYGNGLLNQGWKDSGNAIVDADGSYPEPPIALVEVQGYLYRAWRDMARTLRAVGDDARAAQLDERAGRLQERFDGDYWSDALGFYVLGRQRGGRQIASVASNGGHVLQSGIVPAGRTKTIAERLLKSDMDSGWGIRTLSSLHPAYNPVSYHLGSVWPHDNAIIIGGLRRYGLDDAAVQIFDALVEASTHARDFRLPELYCGMARQADQHRPVPYPVACSPQAWASCSLLHALIELVGFAPDVASSRLRIVRPCLPVWLEALQFAGLRVGRAVVDVTFRREGGALKARADVRSGHLEIQIE